MQLRCQKATPKVLTNTVGAGKKKTRDNKYHIYILYHYISLFHSIYIDIYFCKYDEPAPPGADGATFAEFYGCSSAHFRGDTHIEGASAARTAYAGDNADAAAASAAAEKGVICSPKLGRAHTFCQTRQHH